METSGLLFYGAIPSGCRH